MTIPPVPEGVPDIVCQRILAEGYTLSSADAGKHIFKRNYDWVSRASFALSGGTWDRAPVCLTVSFFPTPKEITIKFTFEIPSDINSRQEQGFQQYCKIQSTEFRKHIEKWAGSMSGNQGWEDPIKPRYKLDKWT